MRERSTLGVRGEYSDRNVVSAGGSSGMGPALAELLVHGGVIERGTGPAAGVCASLPCAPGELGIGSPGAQRQGPQGRGAGYFFVTYWCRPGTVSVPPNWPACLTVTSVK